MTGQAQKVESPQGLWEYFQQLAKKSKSPNSKKNKKARDTQPPKPKPSPWGVTAVILVMNETTCTRCGTVHITPNPGQLLVRFVHKRKPDLIWETQRPANLINPNLPKEVRWFSRTTQACLECYGPEYTIHPQGELFDDTE